MRSKEDGGADGAGQTTVAEEEVEKQQAGVEGGDGREEEVAGPDPMGGAEGGQGVEEAPEDVEITRRADDSRLSMEAGATEDVSMTSAFQGQEAGAAGAGEGGGGLL